MSQVETGLGCIAVEVLHEIRCRSGFRCYARSIHFEPERIHTSFSFSSDLSFSWTNPAFLTRGNQEIRSGLTQLDASALARTFHTSSGVDRISKQLEPGTITTQDAPSYLTTIQTETHGEITCIRTTMLDASKMRALCGRV